MLIALDRDGVLNENKINYVRNESELVVYENCFDLIEKCRAKGCYFFVASNQAGVGKKLISSDALEKIDLKINSYLKKPLKTFYCTHLAEDCCGCRKPMPGLLYQGQHYFDKRVDIFIGDSLTDYQAAAAYGAEFYLVRTGHGKDSEKKLIGSKVKVYNTLAECLKCILENIL